MSSIATPPLDPIVGKNPFRDQKYTTQALPPFAEARDKLPVPVLPNRPVWVEMYWRAWELAWSNYHRPATGSHFIHNYLNTANTPEIYLWDNAFTLQFAVYGRRAINMIGTLNNFYAQQANDGWISRALDRQTGSPTFCPFDPNGTGPNILAWAEWRLFRHTGDIERLRQVFWPLLAYHRWFRAHRTWRDGLYWATGASSGMDIQPRIAVGGHHHQHWIWLDANLQAALSCQLLAQIGTQLSLTNGNVAELTQELTELTQTINKQLWDDVAGFYKDSDGTGRFSPVKSIGAYWGLIVKSLFPEKRRDSLVRQLRAESAFRRAHRVPSMSADSPGYNGETGRLWQGNIWSATNYMVLRGLRTVGQHRLAHEIATNHLQQVAAIFRHTDTLWQNYAPDAATPGREATPNYVGMTGLTPIAILLEDVIGLSVDWPQSRVTWDRRLDTDATYGVQNYPLGDDGTLDIVGDQHKVYVTTDLPFTLTIRDEMGTLQTAVPAGTSEIDLA